MKKLLYTGLTKDQVASRLLLIAKQKLLVKRVVNKYKNNGFYSGVFNEDDVTGTLYLTVTNVINSLEKYNLNKTRLSKKEILMAKLTKKEQATLGITTNEPVGVISAALNKKICKILTLKTIDTAGLTDILSAEAGELKLDDESQMTGYLIVAFTNNIRKIYGTYQTDKRAFKEMVYLDSYNEESENSSHIKNKMDSINSYEPQKEKDFNHILVNMALHLKEQDRKQNKINQNQKSQLAKLFCAIVNPKKVEDNEELRERFGWSQYLLNKNKETMIKKLKEQFNDCQEEVIEYLDKREGFRKAS